MKLKEQQDYEDEEARVVDVGRMFEPNMGESMTYGGLSVEKNVLDKKISMLRAFRDGKDE